MKPRLLLLAALALAGCDAKPTPAFRFERAFKLPVCPEATIAWSRDLLPERGAVGGHSYAAEVTAPRACLDRLRTDFEAAARVQCRPGAECFGNVHGQPDALEDRGSSMVVKVLLP